MPRLARAYVCVFIAAGTWAAALAEGPPTPAESLAALHLADPSLMIELVAGEPEVVGPVAAAWDEFGRLFVAEMTDYPDAPTGGRIRRLEDRDGDGRYEHATAFAEGLHFPNGVLPWNGGVLVTAAPELLFLKDHDGDGAADERRVILTGFGEGNQQLRVNSPTWGADNRVYLANGRSGGLVRRPGDPPEKAVAIPRNDLRVRPATGEFEPVAGFSQFGLPRDDWGDRFPSWNTVPLRHVVLEGAGAVESPTVAEILDLADGGRIFSLAPSPRQFNAESASYFNASCGPTIYRGDLLGARYLGNALVCEPLTSIVHRRRLDPDGPTFSAHRVESGREFLASAHPWFRPVNLATGPDGALYVVDFCRALVEHPAFVPEPRREGVDFREGHDRGRLWRIAPRDPNRRPSPALPGKADPPALVAMLSHANGWTRDTAQRLLVERQDKGAIPALRALARDSASPLGRVHASWTLDGLGALDVDTLRVALRDADPHVREQAVRLAGARAADCVADLAARADDPDARVRLRVAVALSGVEGAPARHALAKVAERDADSRWTAPAILGGHGDSAASFLATLAEPPHSWLADPTPERARFLAGLAARIGSGNRESEAAAALSMVADAPGEAAAFALLGGLARGQSLAKGPGLDLSRPASIGLVKASAQAVAVDEGRPPWVRVLALDVLLGTAADRARAVLPKLIEARQPAEVQSAAARGLARVADPALAATLLEGWDRHALATRRTLLDAMVTTIPLATKLVEAVEQGTLSAAELSPSAAEALRRLGDDALRARVEATLGALPAADRPAVVRRYGPALELVADAARGRDLFARNCRACHARNGEGAKVGPDLIGVVGRPAADLLVAILDPSREVAPDGLGVVVATTDGRTLSGLLAEETPEAVRLRRAEGIDEVVPRGQIEALRPTGRSLMPDGLEQALGPQDMADLIAYLRAAEPAPGPPPVRQDRR